MTGTTSSDPTRSSVPTKPLVEANASPIRGMVAAGDATPSLRADSKPDVSSVPRGSSARWWAGVAVGAIISVPFAWLLSHAASLPFFLGLFFFALFGLVIGAVVHRVASPGRPYSRAVIVVGTTLIVVAGWAFSVYCEGRDLAADMAENAVNRTHDLGGRTRAEHVDHVAGQIDHYLREHYPPGGTLGYVRWVVASGEFRKGELDGVPRTLRQPQRKLWWALRVLLSIGLLAFGVASQTLLLRLPKDPAAVRVGEKP